MNSSLSSEHLKLLVPLKLKTHFRIRQRCGEPNNSGSANSRQILILLPQLRPPGQTLTEAKWKSFIGWAKKSWVGQVPFVFRVISWAWKWGCKIPAEYCNSAAKAECCSSSQASRQSQAGLTSGRAHWSKLGNLFSN